MGTLVQHSIYYGERYPIPAPQCHQTDRCSFGPTPYAGKLLQGKSHRSLAKDLAKGIIDEYLSVPSLSNKKASHYVDGTYIYVISLGLIWHGFHDVIKQSSGQRNGSSMGSVQFYLQGTSSN